MKMITNYASPAPGRNDDLGEDLQTRLHARRQVERLPREQLVPAAAGEGAAQAEVEPGLHLGLSQGLRETEVIGLGDHPSEVFYLHVRIVVAVKDIFCQKTIGEL